MKVVFYVEPQVGGTYSFFEQLRAGLMHRGHELVCVPPVSGERFTGTRFAKSEGVDYVRFPNDLAVATRVLRDHAISSQFDVAMNLPGCDILTTNLLCYLPRSIRTVVNVPMMTEGAYRPVRAIAKHLDQIVCVSERIRSDLSNSILPEKLSVIYNCCDTSIFTPPKSRLSGPLRLVYAGRFEAMLKNTPMLPRILARVREEIPGTTMKIVGHGPDGENLRRLIARLCLQDYCTIIHAVPNHEVAAFYQEADLLVMPSRSEGSPIAMMEAMACGCPPVISRLRGSTEAIVSDGIEGALCRVDDLEDFVGRIVKLGRDRLLLDRMRLAAVSRILGGFTADHLAEKYLRLFDQLLASPDSRDAPLDPAKYEIPHTLRPTWKRFIPQSIKRLVRTQLERRGRST